MVSKLMLGRLNKRNDRTFLNVNRTPNGNNMSGNKGYKTNYYQHRLVLYSNKIVPLKGIFGYRNREGYKNFRGPQNQ